MTITSKNQDIKDIVILLNQANNLKNKSIEKYRIIINIWLKIYYEANYLVTENEKFKKVAILKAKDFKEEIKNIKKTSKNNDILKYLYKLLKKFLNKYDN